MSSEFHLANAVAVSPPPTMVATPCLVASTSASSTALVPFSNGFISNTPTGLRVQPYALDAHALTKELRTKNKEQLRRDKEACDRSEIDAHLEIHHISKDIGREGELIATTVTSIVAIEEIIQGICKTIFQFPGFQGYSKSRKTVRIPIPEDCFGSCNGSAKLLATFWAHVQSLHNHICPNIYTLLRVSVKL